jgi:hypothetical protein
MEIYIYILLEIAALLIFSQVTILDEQFLPFLMNISRNTVA